MIEKEKRETGSGNRFLPTASGEERMKEKDFESVKKGKTGFLHERDRRKADAVPGTASVEHSCLCISKGETYTHINRQEGVLVLCF
jgi:hypothetical protein